MRRLYCPWRTKYVSDVAESKKENMCAPLRMGDDPLLIILSLTFYYWLTMPNKAIEKSLQTSTKKMKRKAYA